LDCEDKRIFSLKNNEKKRIIERIFAPGGGEENMGYSKEYGK